jgi:hypothetical protein
MANFELSGAVKYANPILGFYTEGPWASVALANAGIAPAIRVQGMGCIIQELGQPAKKYWYKEGILDGDLVEFTSGSGSTINDNGVNLLETWSSSKINTQLDLKANLPDGVISGCTITVGTFGGSGTNNDILVSDGHWRKNGVIYNNDGAGDTPFNDIPLSETGLQRYVEIVGTTSNLIGLVDGTESVVAVRPVLSGTQVSLGYILVKDNAVDPPIVDPVGYLPLAGTGATNGTKMSGNIFSRRDVFRIGLDGITDTVYSTGDGSEVMHQVKNGSLTGILKVHGYGAGMTVGLITSNATPANQRTFQVRVANPFLFTGQDARYAADYSADFTARSLIDKGYADATYAPIGGGGGGSGGGVEVTDSGKRTALKLNTNWVNPNDAFDPMYYLMTLNLPTGQAEHDYYIGLEVATNTMYKYLYEKIDGALNWIRIPLQIGVSGL